MIVTSVLFTSLLALAVAIAIIGRDKFVFVVAAILLTQLAYISIRVQQLTGPISVDPQLRSRVATHLKDVCARFDVAVPKVVLRTSNHLAGVFARQRQVGMLLSPELLHALGDDELRAVLAHEVAHLYRDDLRRIRIVAMCNFWVPYAIWVTLAIFVFPNKSTIFEMWIVLFLPSSKLMSLSTGFFNRSYEIGADRDSAIKLGNARAMIEALNVLYPMASQRRDACIGRAPWRWLLLPMALRATSHPSLQRRVRELEALGPSALSVWKQAGTTSLWPQ